MVDHTHRLHTLSAKLKFNADTCSSTMSRNSPEYRAIVKATGKLTKVFRNNLTSICAELFTNDLITPDQRRGLINPNHEALERAADLVQLLTDKVEEDSVKYHTLVKILEEDSATYKDVLECLSLPDLDHTIKNASGKLTRAFAHNMTLICAELVANDLISPDQYRTLRNRNHAALERASDLVQLLTDKVKENPANYHTFVKILEEDRAMYNDVLGSLVPSGTFSDKDDPTSPQASGTTSGHGHGMTFT